MHCEESFKAGKLLISTVGHPGAQGVVAGTQGIGVKTPRAAAVALATVGLANEEHMPKAGMLLIGAKSMMVAASFPPDIVCVCDVTASDAGAAPKLHCITALCTT